MMEDSNVVKGNMADAHARSVVKPFTLYFSLRSAVKPFTLYFSSTLYCSV